VKTYAASADHHRGKSCGWFQAGHSAAFHTVGRPDPATNEADIRVSARAALALIVMSSLGLLGIDLVLIGFGLTRLISNWP